MSASRTLAAICVVSLAAAMTGRGAQKSPGKTSGDSSSDVLPLPAVEKSLPNGFKIIVVPTGFPNIVSLQIPVQTGSRNEVEPGKSGFAHFFEHMMFRGTKAYPSDRYKITPVDEVFAK
jgi:zinc protease